MIALAALALATAAVAPSGSPLALTALRHEATGIHPGDRLHLVVSEGAALVDREVEALQPARLGDRLFVRAEDGAILSVRYAEVRR